MQGCVFQRLLAVWSGHGCPPKHRIDGILKVWKLLILRESFTDGAYLAVILD